MLKSILSPVDCASCKFCCSFRRQSLWETPLFDKKTKESLQKKYPSAVFKKTGNESYTIELIQEYKTENPEEEAPCPFLSGNGCVLTADEKPFDCSIWPFRACKKDGKIYVMLENTCPSINRQPVENAKKLLEEGLGEKIISYAKKNPDMLKDFVNDFKILYPSCQIC